jgi:hypothetical protein
VAHPHQYKFVVADANFLMACRKNKTQSEERARGEIYYEVIVKQKKKKRSTYHY